MDKSKPRHIEMWKDVLSIWTLVTVWKLCILRVAEDRMVVGCRSQRRSFSSTEWVINRWNLRNSRVKITGTITYSAFSQLRKHQKKGGSAFYKLLAKCGDEVEMIQSPSGLDSSKFTLKKVHDRSWHSTMGTHNPSFLGVITYNPYFEGLKSSCFMVVGLSHLNLNGLAGFLGETLRILSTS